MFCRLDSRMTKNRAHAQRRNQGLMSCCVCALIAAASLSAGLSAEAVESGLRKNDRIVFLGDSITAAGVRPDGFVTLVRQSLNKNQAALKIEVIGAGISGHKVPDLQKRLDRDVLSKKPTVVVIYIGINDVWHWGSGRGTKKEDFRKGLHDIIGRINNVGARVVLCTPSMIGEKTDGSNKFDKMLDEYSAISREVAKKTGSQLLDLRKHFVDHLKKANKDSLAKGVLTIDGVHLNPAGNQFVAKQMLKALTTGNTSKNKETGKVLRHVVMFKFKETSSEADVRKVADAFASLPGKIKEIADFEWGTDVSVENKTAGFTHCFVVTFRDEKGRATYLPHPAHKDFISIAGPHIEKVLVVDYWTRK